MDDLISRSELMQAIKRQFRCAECNNYNGIRCSACAGDDMLDLVEDSLAVDAVRVVRCKDCKYNEGIPMPIGILYCSRTDSVVKEDDYCSYSEQMEDDHE